MANKKVELVFDVPAEECGKLGGKHQTIDGRDVCVVAPEGTEVTFRKKGE